MFWYFFVFLNLLFIYLFFGLVKFDKPKFFPLFFFFSHTVFLSGFFGLSVYYYFFTHYFFSKRKRKKEKEKDSFTPKVKNKNWAL